MSDDTLSCHDHVLPLVVDFENKLKAMGFEVNSVADLGHVASVDLTPQRQRDQAARAAKAATQAPSPKASPKLVATKITTTTFSDNKPATTPSGSGSGGGGRSLYSLIKKQTGSPYAAASPIKSQATASLASRARPAPVLSDSFETAEDSFESDLPPSTSSTDEKRTSHSSVQSQSSAYR